MIYEQPPLSPDTRTSTAWSLASLGASRSTLSPSYRFWAPCKLGLVILTSYSDHITDLSAEMILRIQLIGVLVTKGVGEQIHPGPSVEHLKSASTNIIWVIDVGKILHQVWRRHRGELFPLFLQGSDNVSRRLGNPIKTWCNIFPKSMGQCAFLQVSV